MTKQTYKQFSPVIFLGEGWSIKEDNESLPDNWNPKDVKIVQSDKPLKDKLALGAKAFLYYWEHKDEIPVAWKGKMVFFDATVLRNPNGDRYTLCLYWSGDGWGWFYDWLDDDRGAYYLSACASQSSALGYSAQTLDALPLVLEINGFTYKRV